MARPFESLSHRGQLGRLRRLAEGALSAYNLTGAELVPLAHAENTTFLVRTSAERYVLRIHRATGTPIHPPRSEAEVHSELTWLSTLTRETELLVPEPIPTVAGAPLMLAEADGVPTPRICVLFRWGSGRFLDAGLTPLHLERVGVLLAELHDRASGFVPPPGFVRWQVADVSDDAAGFARDVLGERFGGPAAWSVEVVIHEVWTARRSLATSSASFGLIHADLHQENYLFDGGHVRAIDFDDCGFGPFVYDLAVTDSELREHRDHGALRDGLLRGYRSVRALPDDFQRYLDVFHALRVLLLTLWFLEQPDHLSPDRERDVRDGVAELRSIATRLQPS
jgi:Ser/Thr protein kinase RdoA (MazF antagonist)